MNGILVGLSLAIMYLFVTLKAPLPLVWSKNWFAKLDTSTCGIWFYLTTLVLAVVSSALMGLVTRWYKARERDEIPPSRNLVKEILLPQVPRTSNSRMKAIMSPLHYKPQKPLKAMYGSLYLLSESLLPHRYIKNV